MDWTTRRYMALNTRVPLPSVAQLWQQKARGVFLEVGFPPFLFLPHTRFCRQTHTRSVRYQVATERAAQVRGYSSRRAGGWGQTAFAMFAAKRFMPGRLAVKAPTDHISFSPWGLTYHRQR